MIKMEDPFLIDLYRSGFFWELGVDINCFKSPICEELVTQASKGRNFVVIHSTSTEYKKNKHNRLFIRLLEDGYSCWINFLDIKDNIKRREFWQPTSLTSQQIYSRIPRILNWIEIASTIPNKYLWGGTLGPDFDCSGLVQTAFATNGVSLPRDAYQQEIFCQSINISLANYKELTPGDLVFFGNEKNCTHVGIYKGNGLYWHSSGKEYGRNGIGLDDLDVKNKNPVSVHYRNELRGAGRVRHCYDGSTLT